MVWPPAQGRAFWHGRASGRLPTAAPARAGGSILDTTTALVGLGANLGDPAGQLDAALAALAELTTVRGVRASSLWRSRPVDCPPDSPDFVNAVAALDVDADCDALEFLDALLAIETEAGRARSVRNAPRTLDLDLLVFGEVRCVTPRLALPHPRGHLRAFVLVPAAEVAPAFIWPGTGRAIADLAAHVAGREGLERLR